MMNGSMERTTHHNLQQKNNEKCPFSSSFSFSTMHPYYITLYDIYFHTKERNFQKFNTLFDVYLALYNVLVAVLYCVEVRRLLVLNYLDKKEEEKKKQWKEKINGDVSFLLNMDIHFLQ